MREKTVFQHSRTCLLRCLAVALLLSPEAQAFTLLANTAHGDSATKGRQKNEITFDYVTTECPSQEELVILLKKAMDTWNDVRSANLKLKLGTEASVSGGLITSSADLVVICDDNQLAGTGALGTFDNDPANMDADGKMTSGLLTLNSAPNDAANAFSNAEFGAVILAHEIGHSLGLGHTPTKSALMYFAASSSQELALTQDDIDGITYLYPRSEPGDGIFGCGSLSRISGGSGRKGGAGASPVFALHWAGLILLLAWLTRPRTARDLLLRPLRTQEGNILMLVMIFAGMLAAMIPLFNQMVRDASVDSGEARVSSTRKLLFGNIQGFSVSPSAVLQSALQSSWASPAPAAALHNTCLYDCIYGPTAAGAASASSCASQMTAKGITNLGASSGERCQSYDAANASATDAYSAIWYDFTLVLPNDPSVIVAGPMADGSGTNLRYTLDGVPCAIGQRDSFCPLEAVTQFHPVCPGDSLVNRSPSDRPTTPAYPSAAHPAPVACRQAATIQTRVILRWNALAGTPAAGRGKIARARDLDSNYDPLFQARSLNQLPQLPVWPGGPISGDTILGATRRLTYPVKLVAGRSHHCALLSNGTVACWGSDNGFSQMANVTATALRPTLVTGLTDVRDLYGYGDSHCALKSDGYLWCWGKNDFGQVGSGVPANVSTPALYPVNGGVAVASFSMGSQAGLAVVPFTNPQAFRVRCWGFSNAGCGTGTAGQTLTSFAQPSFTNVSTGDTPEKTNVTQVSVGFSHACLLTSDSPPEVWCSGSNANGELGDGTSVGDTGSTTIRTSFRKAILTPGDNVVEVMAGNKITCVRLSTGTTGSVKCWGDGSQGQWGDGTTGFARSSSPASGVTGITNAASLVQGQNPCAILTTGEVKCWGNASKGHLGNNSSAPANVSTPTFLLRDGVGGAPMTGVTQMSQAEGNAGSSVCVLINDGSVRCSGAYTGATGPSHSNLGNGFSDSGSLTLSKPVGPWP